MQPGQMNHYVEVQKKKLTVATDGSGDRTTEYITEFPVYADIDAQSVRDYIASRATQATITHRVVMRYSDAPILDWRDYRLLCDGLFYRIIGALPDNRTGKEWITLACECGGYVWQDQT